MVQSSFSTQLSLTLMEVWRCRGYYVPYLVGLLMHSTFLKNDTASLLFFMIPIPHCTFRGNLLIFLLIVCMYAMYMWPPLLKLFYLSLIEPPPLPPLCWHYPVLSFSNNMTCQYFSIQLWAFSSLLNNCLSHIITKQASGHRSEHQKQSYFGQRQTTLLFSYTLKHNLYYYYY